MATFLGAFSSFTQRKGKWAESIMILVVTDKGAAGLFRQKCLPKGRRSGRAEPRSRLISTSNHGLVPKCSPEGTKKLRKSNTTRRGSSDYSYTKSELPMQKMPASLPAVL